MYVKKIPLTLQIFHGTLLKSVAQLHSNPMLQYVKVWKYVKLMTDETKKTEMHQGIRLSIMGY